MESENSKLNEVNTSQLTSQTVVHIGTKEDYSNMLKNEQYELKLVKVSTSWCGPCKIYKPVFEKYCTDSHNIFPTNKIGFYALDLEDEELDGLFTEEDGISSIPTTLVIKESTVVDKVSGSLSRDKLSQLIVKHLS